VSGDGALSDVLIDTSILDDQLRRFERWETPQAPVVPTARDVFDESALTGDVVGLADDYLESIRTLSDLHRRPLIARAADSRALNGA